MDKIFLRALKEEDAGVSWKWRNDPVVWKHTGRRPNQKITPEIELEWMKNVLRKQDEVRFAICEKDTGKYIGNVQLTGINGYDAEFHIFIGDRKSWGRGYGTLATNLMVQYAFKELHLQSIYLNVKKRNTAAIHAYKKNNFKDIFEYDNYRRMAVYATDQLDIQVSVFVITYNHEKFIKNALDGILKQQVNFNYEIIVGDDCSQDNTRNILLEYATKNPDKMKLLLYPKNISAIANQNWVLTNCTGKYIAMCEGDDFWTDSNKLQEQFNFLENNPDYALTFHDIEMIDDAGSKIEHDRLPAKDKKDYEKDALLLGPYLPTPTLFFRKFDIGSNMNALKKAFNGDAVILSILTQNGKTKYLQNISGSCVRVHTGGTWSSRSYLDRWNSTLKTKQIIFNSLDVKKRKFVFDQYIQIFEMASWDAEFYKSKKYWLQYNFEYLQFCIISGHYGKAWLISRRVFKKILNKQVPSINILILALCCL
jgi:RimJ/RimL family protein N-acetyltransferase